MLGYIRKHRFTKALRSHANYGHKVDVRRVNMGATIAVFSRWEYRDAVRRLVAEAADSLQGVDILYYSELSVTDSLAPEEQVYTKKMLKYGMVPVSPEVDRFLAKEYDRLFFVDTALDKHQQFVIQLAKCRLSIGPLLVEGEHLFDFSIDTQQKPVSYFVDEVIRALDLVSR